MTSTRSYVSMGVAIFGWGLSTTFIQYGLKLIGPFTFLFFRFFLAFILMSITILPKKITSLRKMISSKWVWIIGVSEAAGLLFQYMGQQRNVTAGLASLLSLIFLIIVPFISPFILNQKVKKNHVVAIIFGIIGVLMISSDTTFASSNQSLIGIIFLLLSATSYAVYIVSTSRYSTIENTEVDIFSLFYIVLGIITTLSLIPSLIIEKIEIQFNSELWIWLSLLVLFSTLIAFLAYFEALKEISANSASILLLLQIIIPFSIEFTLGTRYNMQIWSGAAFILLAMITVLKIKEN